jgi:hypothetical protein
MILNFLMLLQKNKKTRKFLPGTLTTHDLWNHLDDLCRLELIHTTKFCMHGTQIKGMPRFKGF